MDGWGALIQQVGSGKGDLNCFSTSLLLCLNVVILTVPSLPLFILEISLKAVVIPCLHLSPSCYVGGL